MPAKFPLVLLDGAEGIAVGLSTKILPHNFNDLCRAAINHLQGKRFRIFPDFATGGIADFSEYNDGARGGKVKVRAKIEQRSKYLLAITELPFGTTTESLIESILAANAKGKLKAALQRAFKANDLTVPANLGERTEQALRQAALDRLGMEARAGNLINGADRVETAARAGKVHLIKDRDDLQIVFERQVKI